jgi:hypothetical protein
MGAIATHAPVVLEELAKLQSGDKAAIQEWARRHRIAVPWVLTIARQTLRFWCSSPAVRGRVWDCNRHDTGALALASMRGRPPARPSELLIRVDHFEWLVRVRVLREPYATIANTPETSRKAVRTLARRLGLQ